MVKRGDVVVGVFGGALGNKPRPAVIVQDPQFETPITILAIPFTSGLETVSAMRPVFDPDGSNGLAEKSCLMTDKLSPIRRDMIGAIAGTLGRRDIDRVEVAIQIILGMNRIPGAD